MKFEKPHSSGMGNWKVHFVPWDSSHLCLLGCSSPFLQGVGMGTESSTRRADEGPEKLSDFGAAASWFVQRMSMVAVSRLKVSRD